MAAADRADAVVIGTPNQLHAEQVRVAAAHGLHALVEKPMASTVADCDAMIEAADTAGVVLAVGHMQRYLPDVIRTRALLADGVIGTPRLIVERRAARYEPGTRQDWFLTAEQARGGIITNLGAHSVDKVAFLADGWFSGVQSAWSTGSPVATEAIAQLRIEDRVAVTMSLAGTGLPGGEVTEVVGTTGALRLSAAGIEVFERGELVRQLDAAPNRVGTAFTAQLDAFCDGVAGGTPPPSDGRYGRAVMALLEQLIDGVG